MKLIFVLFILGATYTRGEESPTNEPAEDFIPSRHEVKALWRKILTDRKVDKNGRLATRGPDIDVRRKRQNTQIAHFKQGRSIPNGVSPRFGNIVINKKDKSKAITMINIMDKSKDSTRDKSKTINKKDKRQTTGGSDIDSRIARSANASSRLFNMYPIRDKHMDTDDRRKRQTTEIADTKQRKSVSSGVGPRFLDIKISQKKRS